METDFQQALKALSDKLGKQAKEAQPKAETKPIKTTPVRPKRRPSTPRPRRIGPNIPSVKGPGRVQRIAPAPLEGLVAVEKIGNRIRKDIRPATFGVMQYMDAVNNGLTGGASQTQFGQQAASTGFGRAPLAGAKGRIIRERGQANYLGRRAVESSIDGLGAHRGMSARRSRR